MIGYAVTTVISAESPEGHRVQPPDWWKEILKVPEARVIVIHDVDRPVLGSFWGEVNANTHKAVGCVGAVTDGSVRDMTEVKEAGFHFLVSCVSVSHACVHLVDVGVPVTVGGLVVKPGDLIMGDLHGVLSISPEIANDLPGRLCSWRIGSGPSSTSASQERSRWRVSGSVISRPGRHGRLGGRQNAEGATSKHGGCYNG